MTEFGLDERILEKIIAVIRCYPAVEKAVIYGSRAKGTFKNYSDIDLAVYAPGITDVQFAKLHFELDELPLVFQVDVVEADRLGQTDLKRKIDAEGKVIYSR